MTAPRIRFAERHVLLWILVVFLVTYGLAFLFVALRHRVERADTIQRPTVHWMPAQRLSSQQFYAELMDPSLLSLPNLNGYSRHLWQRSAPAQHRSLAPGVELAYLEPRPAAPVATLLPQAPLAEALRSTVVKPVTAPMDLPAGPALEPVTFATQSVFHVAGPLADRLVTLRPPLVTVVVPVALRSTRVRIGVSADGTVRYATLQRSSSNEGVDAQAIALAREIRFEPQNRPDEHDIIWGVVRFQWATTPPEVPAATN